ncbi:pyridoxine/pyridoxamine 5'-phosphate oxidase [Lacisediminihabitans sp. FW035]
MNEPSSPWQVIEQWLPANDEVERPQMNLATVSITGEPDARTVLLSEYDSSGFYFHTDALSRKAAAIVANPAVALTFLWPGFTRQLVVQGRAEVAPAEEISAAYRARSPFLQQLAWQNTFEFAQYPDEERRARWAAFTAEHSDGATPVFPQPDTWIGFLVRPTRMTFWTSGSDTPSRRVEYRATSGGWTVAYLPG